MYDVFLYYNDPTHTKIFGTKIFIILSQNVCLKIRVVIVWEFLFTVLMYTINNAKF